MRGDPYWLKARFPGECAKCKARFAKGGRIFYYPRDGRTLCEKDECGGAASRDFDAHAFDDAVMGGGW
jgi:hypothetical protein